jgi:hypothetical protein
MQALLCVQPQPGEPRGSTAHSECQKTVPFEEPISDRSDIVVVVIFVVDIGFSTTMTTTAIADNDNDEVGLSEQH